MLIAIIGGTLTLLIIKPDHISYRVSIVHNYSQKIPINSV